MKIENNVRRLLVSDEVDIELTRLAPAWSPCARSADDWP